MPQIKKLSFEEKNAMKELEIRMKSVLPPNLQQDSSIFYRFLKARDFDVNKAEKMLRKHIEWRRAQQADTILEDYKPKEVFLKQYQPTVLGYDKEGDVVIYGPVGNIEAKEIFRCVKLNELLKCLVWFEETILSSEKHKEKAGRITQSRIIMDLNELSVTNTTSKITAEFLLRLFRSSQDNYPERIKAFHVINAPSYYMIIYSIVKPVVSKVLLQKFNSFGNSGWKEHLLEYIDADVLPAFLGGNRTDPDGNPMCNTFVRHGGKALPIYYLSEEDRYFDDVNRTKKLVIPPMEKEEIFIEVTENRSRIQWKFLVKDKDIGFGLSFRISETQVEELLPIEKYSTIDGTEEGSYKCRTVGKYIITFDNSHSYMTSKEIEYFVMVVNDE